MERTPEEMKDDVRRRIEDLIEELESIPITGYGEEYANNMAMAMQYLNAAIESMNPAEDFSDI